MNKSNRLIFQIVLWSIIWLLLSFAQNLELQFIKESIPTFISQIMLIAFLIYYAAPNFLFKKRYLQFFLISVLTIVLFSFLASFFLNRPLPPPPELLPSQKPDLAPPILFHLSQSFILLIAYFLALFIENMWFLQQKEQETILIKSEAVQSELKLLKSQINPHFLFNTLNNIYALAGIDTNKTQQSISYLSDMLRYVLYECEQSFVPLQKEVKYLEDYIQLFSLKSSRKYPINLSVNIEDTSVEIAPMILLPFVENALKHSYIEKSKTAFIDISLKATKDNILFEIENSLPESTIQKDETGGIGLENVQKRLTILYPKKHDLSIANNKTFKVALTIKTTKHA